MTTDQQDTSGRPRTTPDNPVICELPHQTITEEDECEQQRLAVPAGAEATEPREHCGNLKPQFSESTERTECVLRPGHTGSHADHNNTRWWWTDEAIVARPTTTDEPATITDPEWLRQEYAGALYERERPPRDPHWAGAYAADREVFEAMADAVLRVRDRHLEQLRQRLDLADATLRHYTEADSADAAAGSYAGRAEAAEAFVTFVADTIADHEGDEWANHPATTTIRAAFPAIAHRVWTPPPPGDRREQLPDHLLDLIRPYLRGYTSTACQTAGYLAQAAVDRPEHAVELGVWQRRMGERCRRNQKYTGEICPHHTAKES